jgi:hypothetical protein
LNDPNEKGVPKTFNVGTKNKNHYGEIFRDDSVDSTYQEVQRILLRTKPMGLTPLTTHINYLQNEIRQMTPTLNKNGQKVVIVIATDGLPQENNNLGRKENMDMFVRAMRSLEGLPVWIVIRLCTDEEEVVNFYNDLDEQLELSLEVLDDFESEALEVYEYNKWLNYALPIHRLRELGFYDRVFDLIDERTLTKSELREFCVLLFGEEHFDSVPDPSIDWIGFMNDIGRIMSHEQLQWNPVKKKSMPWIDMKELNKMYGNNPTDCTCTIL